jgi:uncharacterized protein
MGEPADRTLVPGRARGTALVLSEPLSFWGGIDPSTGRVIDAHHPQEGATVTGRILVMPSGRGSSSSSYVLAESIRIGTAPAAVVLGRADPIVALGAIVAAELYGTAVPVVVAGPEHFAAIEDGATLEIEAVAAEASILEG